MLRILWISLPVLALLGSQAAEAQPQCGTAPEMLLVIDRSGSMTGLTGTKSKWSLATTAVKNLTSKYASQIRFALMVFPGSTSDCSAGVVNVTLNLNNHVAISKFLASTYPTGLTPMGDSIKAAHNFLTKLPGKQSKKYVLMITDGSETCGGKALNWVKALSSAGIKTYVVGFGSGVNAIELNNLALQGGTATPGTTKYYKADSSSQLNNALQSIGALVSCCGNGAVDASEKCDKAIPPGQKGACPKSAKDCDDGKACTTDAPTGSECDVTCSHTQVTKALNGDGCCPPGTNSTTDNDCPTSCGNGILEKGEDCDPGIISGTGKCKTASDCDDKDTCTKDVLAGTGCNPKCQNSALLPDPQQKDSCCPKGNTLDTDADCPPKCGPDKEKNCVDLCKGVNCPDGQYCNSGKCIPWPKNPSKDAAAEGLGREGEVGRIDGDDGCACRVGQGPPPWSLILLLLGFIAFRRFD